MKKVEPQIKPETEAEARARRLVHVVGALVVLLTVAIVVWAVFGGAKWAKDRQTAAIQKAAQVDLELVANAQKMFFKIHGFYTTDLKALNLWPKRVLYSFGFTAPAAFKKATENPDGGSWDPEMRTINRLAARRAEDAIAKAKEDPAFKPDPPILLSPLTKIKDIDLDQLAALCADCTATESTFKVIAAANLDNDDQLDVWTIDEKGNVEQLANDLK